MNHENAKSDVICRLASVTALMLVSIVVGMRETRSSVLLTRLARKLRKETGDNRYRARIEDERASIKTLIFISCTRPLRTSRLFFV